MSDGGASLSLERHGSPVDGVAPLVLIHGGAGTVGAHFGAVIPLFTCRREVIGVELQGHGHSPFTGREYTFENNADDVAEALSGVAGPVDVLGFSNGGPTAVQLAVRHPGLVRRLVVVSGFSRRDGFVDGFWDGFDQPGVDESSVPAPLAEAYKAIDPDPEHFARMFRLDLELMTGFTDRPDDELRGLFPPTLFLGGDEDIVTAAHTVEMASLAPQGRLAILPGGHGTLLGIVESGPLDDALVGATVTLVERFLDG